MKIGNSKRLKIMTVVIAVLFVVLVATIVITVIRARNITKGSNAEVVDYVHNEAGEVGYYDDQNNFVSMPQSAIILGEDYLQNEMVGKLLELTKKDPSKEGLESSRDIAKALGYERENSQESEAAPVTSEQPETNTDKAETSTDTASESAEGDTNLINPEDLFLSTQYNENKIKYLELLGFKKAEDADTENPEAEAEEEPAEEPVQFLSVYYAGVDDPSVAYIQEKLMQLGFMENSDPTEHYGPITMEAVKLFQRQNDLKQDGIIGEQTIAMLFDDNAKSYLLKSGMEGDDIRRVQKRLYELGYLATLNKITGVYDDATIQAVKSLQTSNGLAGDGKIGAMTNELLYSEDVKANLISFGDKSDIVLECQKRLKELGYMTTEPDGLYGNDTLAAVKQFQSRNDCIVDGYLGPSTRAVLNSSTAKANGIVLGDSGDTVKRIQELLIKYGYMDAGSATGYFGEVTEAAVKQFQGKNGLHPDGNVGQQTMTKLTGTNVCRADNSGGNGGNGGNNGDKGTTGGKDNKPTSGGSKNDNNETVTYSGSVDNLIKVAKTKIGCSYVWGSKGPNTFDCSGFVYWCLKQVGVNQSYITSSGWRTVGKYKKNTDFNSIKKGDVVVVYGHVGIAAGNGEVIDASSSAGKIVYRTMGDWWKRNFICSWTIFG